MANKKKLPLTDEEKKKQEETRQWAKKQLETMKQQEQQQNQQSQEQLTNQQDQQDQQDQEEQEYQAPKFEELVKRFQLKVAMIPTDCHEAIMLWHMARRTQEARIAVENQLRQVIKIGKKVFWSDNVPDSFKKYMLEGLEEVTVAEKSGNKNLKYFEMLRKQEDAYVRGCDKAFRQSQWFNEVALAAAEGVGMGPMLAGALLWIIGDVKRFPTFGRLVKYAGLSVTPEGKAPKRRKGGKVDWSPPLRTTLYKLTEGWNKIPDSVWRAKWDGYKVKLAEERSEILKEVNKDGKPCGKGHIHNMARRLVQREFLRSLYSLWMEFEVL